MRRRTGLWAAVCAAGVLILAPASASAITDRLRGRAAVREQGTVKYGAAVNAFFLSRVTIHQGDSVKFLNEGFHDIDLPGSKGKAQALILPGPTENGVNDAAGQPFWFNGKRPSLSLNPAVVIPKLASTYDGTTQIVDPAPAWPVEAGDRVVHQSGDVRVLLRHPCGDGRRRRREGAGADPSAKQDRTALAAQVKAAVTTAKRYSSTRSRRTRSIRPGRARRG